MLFALYGLDQKWVRTKAETTLLRLPSLSKQNWPSNPNYIKVSSSTNWILNCSGEYELLFGDGVWRRLGLWMMTFESRGMYLPAQYSIVLPSSWDSISFGHQTKSTPMLVQCQSYPKPIQAMPHQCSSQIMLVQFFPVTKKASLETLI